jgi:hypothetical protein
MGYYSQVRTRDEQRIRRGVRNKNDVVDDGWERHCSGATMFSTWSRG